MISKNPNKSFIVVALAVLLVGMLVIEGYSIVHLNSRIDRLEAGSVSVSRTSPIQVLTNWARALRHGPVASASNVDDTGPSNLQAVTPAPPSDWVLSQAAPVDWNPFEQMERLHQQMDQLFGYPDFWSMPSLPVRHLAPAASNDARVALHEQPNRFVVDVDLPGATESDIHFTLDGQQLTVSADRSVSHEKRNAQGNIVESEQSHGSFQEILTLPGPVEASQVTSHFQDGVLEISIPRANGDTAA